MTAGQERIWSGLVHMGYRPVMRGHHTDGCVHVVIAKKLDAGICHLHITPDGTLTNADHRDRQRHTQRTH